MNPQSPLLDLNDFNLSLTVLGATGNQLLYKSYIEAEVFVPSLVNNTFVIPVLVVNNTECNNTNSSVIETNVMRLCKQSAPTTDIPAEWQTAFDSMCDTTLPVKATNSYSLKIGPGEIKTLHDVVRKENDMDTAVPEHCHTAVTEHIDSSLSGDLTICPRVFSLKSPGTTVRLPVRVYNLSTRVIEVPPKSLLCSLSSVKIIDPWTPDSSQKKAESTTTSSLEDMGVKIDSN